ncbi:MAG TPA: DMT family transporter [Gemmatimonadales bacterium]|jgi:drug/metabolite transporter (DMT)-like permease
MLLVCLIWGLNFSVTKAAFAEFPPLAFTAIRFAIASALLWPVVRYVEGDGSLPRGSLTRLIVLGIVGNTLYQIGFISGLARTSASNSALILASMPSLVALLAAGLGLEPARPRVIGGVLVATTGVVLVIAARGAGFGEGELVGDVVTLAAVFCWAGYTLGLRTLPPGITPLRVTMITTIVGTPGLLLAAVPELIHMRWDKVGVLGLGALAYATLLSLVLAYLIWNRSVQLVGPSRTVIYMCITPLVGVTGAALMLGERLRPLQGVGATLILAGVLLVRRAPPTAPLPAGDVG